MSDFRHAVSGRKSRGSFPTKRQLKEEADYYSAIQNGETPPAEVRWKTRMEEARTALSPSVPDHHVYADELFYKIAALGISSVPVDINDPSSSPLACVAKDAIDWMEALHAADKHDHGYAAGFVHSHAAEELSAREALKKTMSQFGLPQSLREAVAKETIEAAQALKEHRALAFTLSR